MKLPVSRMKRWKKGVTKHMDAHNTDIPRMNSTNQRLYIDVSKDLFDTFHKLKKILDEWDTTREAGKTFVKEAVRIPVLHTELVDVTGSKSFADKVVRNIYTVVFYDQELMMDRKRC